MYIHIHIHITYTHSSATVSSNADFSTVGQVPVCGVLITTASPPVPEGLELHQCLYAFVDVAHPEYQRETEKAVEPGVQVVWGG